MQNLRTPDWDGAFNLVDLGGLPLVDGGTTTRGRVFRSGRTESLTDQGWSDLGAAGVSTVIDLRNDTELARRPWDPEVSDSSYSGVYFAHTPTEDPENKEFQEVCGPWLDHPRSYPDNLRLFPSKVMEVFNALEVARGAALIHCSGGRDRTGLITAMLLHLTGVEITAITEDYAEALRTASRHVALMTELHPEQVHERPYSDEEIEVRARERTEVLGDWLDGFDVSAWLTTTGMPNQDVRAVQAQLIS